MLKAVDIAPCRRTTVVGRGGNAHIHLWCVTPVVYMYVHSLC